MRGKSKQSAVSSPNTGNLPEMGDLSVMEHTAICPIFTQALNSALDIKEEDLPGLQQELTSLLDSVKARIETLKVETQTMCDLLDRSEGPDAKLSKTDNPYVRHLRDTPCRSEANSPAPSRPKQKKTSTDKATLESLGRPPKSDAPEKFWALVEPYCADVTSEDLKTLEDLLRMHEDDMDYYKIPSLGKHYSQRWLTEDQEMDRKDAAKFADKKVTAPKRRLNSAGESSYSTEESGPRSSSEAADNQEEEEVSPFGSLTQRLVAALIEENSSGSVLMSSLEQELSADSLDAAGTSLSDLSPSVIAKELNITNTSSLEKRLRKELLEQGFLEEPPVADSEPPTITESKDEILEELRQKQQELRAISQQNMSTTRRLHRLAKDEIQRQELKRKLAVIDADVIEAYKKIQLARSKKRPTTKREKDFVIRAIKERESLVKQLDSVGL